MKVDLDAIFKKLDELSHCVEVQISTKELMDLCLELKAAREFIGKVQEIENCFDDNLKYDELKFAAICDALRLYGETTK